MEAAPVYQEPVSEPAPVVMETTPNAESVAPVVEEAPVYQEPADEPATETINMNAQQPVYQEPADELATETIDMNA